MWITHKMLADYIEKQKHKMWAKEEKII